MENNPIELFKQWYNEAINSTAPNPTAAALATASATAKPSVRFVLLKFFDEKGFVFYTNLNSRKAQELSENPQAALCFYWPLLEKQIRIEGSVEPVNSMEADDYFSSRSRESKIAAWASKQSQTMQSPNELEQSYQKLTERYQDKSIPRPEFWSGFRIKPEIMEFWTAGEHRLHHRVYFYRDAQNKWQHQYLYP